MKDFPQPRLQYGFEDMIQNDVKKIAITNDDPTAGVRARGAAYAYARRNGWRFCGAVERIGDKKWMVIRRVT